MTLQIAPVPYRGDQYLFQGISSAGQNIAEGIEGMTKRLRQTKAMRTMAVDGMGMDPDKVDNMTPEQIQGIMQGMAVRNANAESASRVQMEQAHADYFQRFNQKSAAADRFSQAVNQYMQPPVPNTGSPMQQPPTGDIGTDLMNGPDPTGVMQAMTQPRTLDPQTLMRLEAQAGTLDPEKAMEYAKQMTGGSGPHQFFKPTDPMAQDIPGLPGAKRVILGEDNSQIIRDNSGTAPDAPPGYQMVGDGKGGWKPVKIDASKLTEEQRRSLIFKYQSNAADIAGKMLYMKRESNPEVYDMLSGFVKDHADAVNDLKQTTTPSSKPAGQYKSADEVKAALKSGALNKADALKILQSQFGMK